MERSFGAAWSTGSNEKTSLQVNLSDRFSAQHYCAPCIDQKAIPTGKIAEIRGAVKQGKLAYSSSENVRSGDIF